MKKLLLLLAICAGSGSLMAQSLTNLAPFDNTLNNKLVPTFKIDSTWRVNPPTVSTDKLFKQQNIDLSKIRLDNTKTLLIAAEGFNMPILNLNNTSKTPVIVLDGNSKMPVAGKGITKADKITLIHP